MPSAVESATTPSPDVVPVLAGLLRDAVLLAERGTATPEDIDTAMRLGAGHPAGPFAVLASLSAPARAELGLRPPPRPDRPPVVPPSGTSGSWTGPVGVVGTGHMAGGIAEAVARSGRPVRVLGRSAASGEALRSRLAAGLDRAVSRGRLDEAGRDDVLGRVRVGVEAADLSDVDVVVEAVAEDLAVKTAVLARLDDVLPPDVPVATNTSSFRVGDLRPFVRRRPVLALHFFNPAQVMALVEIVVPDDVPGADDLRATADAWARDLGKTPITSADARGFVVNRLLIPFLNDAVRLLETGCGAQEVDDLLRAGAGHPMGPLALIDLIGLDVTIAALESMAAVETDPRLSPAAPLRDLAAAGRLGRKTGAGFHTY